MATLVKQSPKTIFQQMAEDKKKIEGYFKSGDESKKPKGIQFVKPFTLSTKRR